MEKELEIWADSFHEGVWCCDNILTIFNKAGYKSKTYYINGFIPVYEMYKDTDILRLVVYGSYKTWNPLPSKIEKLLEWGKPDFLAYDPISDTILFAVEETAATPTGNQATQRCERQYGSARAKIPYWYLVSEYGQHIDGGVRRDSIWPTVAGIKLTIHFKTPCIVLHYSDIDNVEDYSSGKGLNNLFATLEKVFVNYMNAENFMKDTESLLNDQYKEMSDFLISQWDKVVDFLPSLDLLKKQSTFDSLARYALKKQTNEDINNISDLLVWPLRSNLPKLIQDKQKGKPLIKFDALSELLEADVTNKKAYVLSNNAGSGKPPKYDKIQEWVGKQKKLYDLAPKLVPPANFDMKPEDFPETENGNRHITTAKNIVYLYDRFEDLKESIEKVFLRLKGKIKDVNNERPAFLYLSNSLKPGRLFGDPYTGQLSAFSTAFGKFDKMNRVVIVYFPHQVYSQAIKGSTVVVNKGTTLLSELTDYIIFNGGVVVSLKKKEIL